MSGLLTALELHALLEKVGDRIKDSPRGRSYLSPDGRAYVLAIGGDNAKAMHDFMTAVGQYLMKVQHGRGDKELARAELLQALDEWLSKQNL